MNEFNYFVGRTARGGLWLGQDLELWSDGDKIIAAFRHGEDAEAFFRSLGKGGD